VVSGPVVVSPEAEEAFGLGKSKVASPSTLLAPAQPTASNELQYSPRESVTPEPERSKTFFLPYSLCERLEMQKLSEKREMKHIVRQALEDYFARNPLRQAVRDLYRST
jgi:recombinational DNA repair protein (RecF pathway)